MSKLKFGRPPSSILCHHHLDRSTKPSQANTSPQAGVPPWGQQRMNLSSSTCRAARGPRTALGTSRRNAKGACDPPTGIIGQGIWESLVRVPGCRRGTTRRGQSSPTSKSDMGSYLMLALSLWSCGTNLARVWGAGHRELLTGVWGHCDAITCCGWLLRLDMQCRLGMDTNQESGSVGLRPINPRGGLGPSWVSSAMASATV